MAEKKKSYQARKNEGNDLFFRILHNILTDKSAELFNEHVENPTFDDVYTFVGIEKGLQKCYDMKIVRHMISVQLDYTNIKDKKTHYWFLLKSLPRTFKGIDWRNGV